MFEPLGIFTSNDEIVVLDRGGSQIKIFSQEGRFVSSCDLKDGRANSIVVSGDRIIANVLGRKNYRRRLPLSVYTKNFEKIGELGTQVKCGSFAAYRCFNEAYVCLAENSVCVAFRSFPALFRVDMQGATTFYNDLTKISIEEIAKIAKEGKKRKVDTPQSIRNESRVRSMVFCNGLGTDSSGDIFYGLNYDAATKGLILHFSGSGELKEKLILRLEGEQARIEGLYIRDNLRLALASTGKERLGAKICLLEF